VIPRAIDVVAARQRLHGHIDVTPLRRSEWLTAVAGARASLKLECVQRTGSFKIRGAINALSRLSSTHVVTASAGNHGRAVALAAQALGMAATVFVPRSAPQGKRAAIERHGADLRLVASYDEAEVAARAFAQETGRPFISPYNHEDVIAGAGTTALEIFDAEPDIRTIVVPVGGGGLIAGVAIAARAIAPGVRIVGVEAEASHAMLTSVRAGRITTIDPQPTLADGLAGNLEPGAMTFAIVQRDVDEIVTATEAELRRAIAALAAEEHVIAEGAGAAAVAALIAGKVRTTGATAAIVSGGNIDPAALRSILDS
jgi:threonine dehydratase